MVEQNPLTITVDNDMGPFYTIGGLGLDPDYELHGLRGYSVGVDNKIVQPERFSLSLTDF